MISSKKIKRFIFKFSIDIWGNYLAKKKFNSKFSKKILLNFENFLRFNMIRKIRPADMYLLKYVTKKKLKKSPSLQYPKKYNMFFKHLFKYYFLHTKINKLNNILLSSWTKSMLKKFKYKTPSILYDLNYQNFFSIGKKLPYIKRNNYINAKKLDFYKYKFYYCFSSNTRFKNILKKIEYSFHKNNLQFGISSLFLDVLFKTNLFPTTRFSYTLIKIGGVFLNDFKELNPYKQLFVFDHFRINPFFFKIIIKLFLRRLKKKFNLVYNIPNYIDFDYKIMSFYIWRLPTDKEKRLIPNLPFLRSKSIDSRVLDLKSQIYKRRF